MERSEGGQRLVEVEEISRLLEERRRASAARPIVAQSARNHFPGIVTRIERDRVAAVVEVHRRTASARQPDDGRGRRRPRPEGRRRGGLRRQGHQRHRRDPVRARSPAHEARTASSRPSSPSSSRPARAAAQRRRRRHPPHHRGADRQRRRAPSAAAVELTIFAAASLKNVLAEAETAYEAANPGTDLTISTDSSAALETQIEQGAPADVFLSADTTNPQKLVDGGFAAGEPVDLRRQQADRHRPDRQPGGDPVAGRPREGRASRSSPPATRCRSRSTPRSSSTNLAAEEGYPADFAAAYAANVVSKEDNVSAGRRQDRAR